jgi:hypothetical protein
MNEILAIIFYALNTEVVSLNESSQKVDIELSEDETNFIEEIFGE